MRNNMLQIIENRQVKHKRLIHTLDPSPTPEQMKELAEDFVELDPVRHEANFDPGVGITFNWDFPKTYKQHLKDRRVFRSFLRMRGFNLV